MGVGRLVATAPCTAFCGVVEGSGERVGERLLYQRVSFLAGLCEALAWSAARWAVDQTAALGATAIYLEDLATLRPVGAGAVTAGCRGRSAGPSPRRPGTWPPRRASWWSPSRPVAPPPNAPHA